MDPLMAAASHNLTCSRLCQLPDDILIGIMKLLDPLDMQCLRRACRLFLRLYCDPTFVESHDIEGFWSHPSEHQFWLSPDSSYWPKLSGPALISRLVRDVQGLCGTCRSMRAKSDWASRTEKLISESLYCSGCKKHHPLALFSPDQRREVDDRICFGREGHIRLCDHKVVTWETVSKAAKQLINIDCGLEAKIQVSRCDHRAHYPRHHNYSMEFQCPNVSPTAEICGVEGHSLILSLTWQGHMLVEGDRPITPQVLCKHLGQFRKGVAKFIAPKLAPGRFPEMSCFDPNCCDCLYFEGMEQLPDWPRPSDETLKLNSCRLHPEFRLRALRNATDDSESWPDGHKALLRPIANSEYGASELRIVVEPCVTGDSRCLSIRYRRNIELSYPTDERTEWLDRVTPAWCQALEPDSYESTLEAIGVNWCYTLGCMNYYEYLRKAVAPVHEVE
ncbi:unnamed protein product [Clonostachys rosea]|uniref:F-box domain-containing protein n=1 Tax=Bionectria ochroleuca TaxID=29856 RepID=A0ABY6UE16_BIOOC|nr:unnamed protein product [Clonostachys rosea]